jgi:predicted TIM-barrel fold metal-dependent hydrolase
MRISRWTLTAAAVAVSAALASGQGGRGQEVRIKPGEECPPGMTEFRPQRCLAPSQPPPSIVDYRPRSTVVAQEHLVPKAKYPVVDIHNHTNITSENIEPMVREMDELNLRVLVNLTAGAGNRGVDGLKQNVDFLRGTPHKDRFRVFAWVNWDGAGTAEWRERETKSLKAQLAAGAIGLKIAKNLGLTARKADGSRLKVDDPDLDPIWQICADAKVPVIIHTADPQQFFVPVDLHNERWLELNLFAGRNFPSDKYPSFETVTGERDRMYKRNPKTTYIGAHFNWYGNDLGKVAKQLDDTPNLVLEVGAVLYEFGRQPRGSRDLFVKYQDRILFGKDAYEKSEFPYYWRVFETKDEYFDYYRDYHAFWKLYGMDLPDEVLKKLYYKNALRVAPGLPQTGWPR